MDKVDITIIGAGVVGLAIAAELGDQARDVLVLEKENSFGQHTSSRNSEVIHAGIYYPKDSLKARLCVEGNKLLYSFCDKYHIPYAKTGKLIVAKNEAEANELVELNKQALINGVNDLTWLSHEQIKEKEEAVSGYQALFSPSTGIIDSHTLMKTLERLAKSGGVMFSYDSTVTAIRREDKGYLIKVNNKDEIFTKTVVNSAGLFSDQVAAMAGIDIDRAGYRLHYCKGEYFSFTKPSFLKHLVYPVPEADIKGLGIHAVLDLGRGLKFGPSTEYVKSIDYKVDPANKDKFLAAIKDFYPQIKGDDLIPDQAGVRPKLQGPKDNFRDFVINEEANKGLPGLINLIGIESPGLTASLAIAKEVVNLSYSLDKSDNN